MRQNWPWVRAFLAVGVVSGGLWVVGCDSTPPPAGREAQTRPVEEPVEPAPEPVVEPAVQPPPAEPEEPPLPEYITVIGRFTTAEPADVRIITAEGRRLAVDTRNVRRLYISRDKLPLDKTSSIALILDGQGLEWLPNSEVVEFERSINGAWSPVKPGERSRRPRTP